MAAPPTITVTWGELFDRIADLELALEQGTDATVQSGIEENLELLRDQARADAPGAVHAVASELKDVAREIVRLDAEIAAFANDSATTTAFVELVRDHRSQRAKRLELRTSIDHLMRDDTEGRHD